MKKLIAVAVAASVLSGCATYQPHVESSVTEMSTGRLLVDTRSDSTKVTRGEALQSNLFEAAKYIQNNYPSQQCFVQTGQQVDLAYQQYVITTGYDISECGANTFNVGTVIKSVSALHAKQEAKFKEEQKKQVLKNILVGAAVVGGAVAASN